MKLTDCLHVLWRVAKAAKHTFVVESKIVRDMGMLRNSRYFDAEWYLKENPDVEAAGVDPCRHYLLYGGFEGRSPSPFFCSDEYLALNLDVRYARINPLVHYEKFGRREGRIVSYLDMHEPTFPKEARNAEMRFARVPRLHGRTALVGAFFKNGEIPDTLVYLLKGIREVADNVVLVADCPVRDGEAEKIRGLVHIAKFERHGQYDFGSYKRAYEIAASEGLLSPEVADELILMNDSCYGPVYPLAESFATMGQRQCDFWGMTSYRFFDHLHIASYFYVFKRRVIDSGDIGCFLARVHGPQYRDKVIVQFEVKFTDFLCEQGFKFDTLVPYGVLPGVPVKHPIALMRDFRAPLLKVKTVNGNSYDDIQKVLAYLRKENPTLASMIKVRPLVSRVPMISMPEHQASFCKKAAAIGAKISSGGRAKAVFIVTTSSMFPLRPLFDAMTADPAFETAIAVVPDMRWRENPLPAMQSCEEGLRAMYPNAKFIEVRQDDLGMWPDILADADIVGYPSPYDISNFMYNPRYAVGRNLLPIHANYGFYRSLYDRHVVARQNYAYFWKVFVECEETMREYAEYSLLKGTNGDLVGYVKMDALAAVKPERHERKRILVALHHSVEGGANKTLSLANFVRYADFFMALPDRYPEIDFVFRPHPFLFKVMSRSNQWGKARTERYVAELKAKPNVIWSDGGDYFREFAESDACIQDCGSYLVEYFYTKKPCCYMLKDPSDIDKKFAPLGKKCLENCYVAYNTDAIDRFIRDVVVAGNDPKAESRAEFAKRVMVNYPHAAGIALEHIKAALHVS